MTGLQVKQILLKNGYVLNDIATKLGESSQNFSAALKVKDIKTGILERIATAIDKPIGFFFDSAAPIAFADSGSNAVAGNNNNINADMSIFLDLIAKKDEQIDRLLKIIESK